jgi:ABC-2 type transport system ATP-binding protein
VWRVITARGLGKRYGDVQAVHDLSFDVRPGVVTGFLGPNGAGKSTAMRLMLDLDRGSGETLFDGRRYRDLVRPLRTVGAVLEARSFHPTRRARNHLRMLAAASGVPAARVDEVIGLVGLESVARGRPKGFSLGMSQRLSLAAAMLGDPEVLLLDEPANGLDPQGIQWLRLFLRAFAEQGRTVLVSSHLLAEMSLIAQDLVVIGRGKLIAAGTVDEFVRRFTRRAALVRSPRAGELAELLRGGGHTVEAEPDGALLVPGLEPAVIGELAAGRGIVLHELTTRSASLEEAFLEATGGATTYDARPAGPVAPVGGVSA